MNRSQFLLSLTLMCVAGTIAFTISFRHREAANSQIPQYPAATSSPRISTRDQEPASLPLSPKKSESVDPTHYEVTVNDIVLQERGSRIERESLQRLQAMTDKFQLTANQRRQVFPLLVTHHADFLPGLVVNGQSAKSPGDLTLSEQIYPLLDLNQQEAYQTDILADTDWWGEILGQFRDELDQAFENGEVDLINDNNSSRRSRKNGGNDSD